MDIEHLLYRRQFILGDRPIPDLPEWGSISFASFFLKVHPDLEVTIAKGGPGDFLMLGFVLNHKRPEANNQEIMDALAETCHNLEKMLEYCRDLCGRYLILFSFSGKTGIVNDLIGSRSVYWCVHQGSIWCGSQPSTIAKILSIEEDISPTVQAYMEVDMFVSGEGCWIGDGTKYSGVKHLLPNHYLDFQQKKPVRYWPISQKKVSDIQRASRESAKILEHTMQAATNRFRLSMAITAGWDSRTMLAATRNVRSKIFYYIQQYGGMAESHPDIRVPRALTQKLNIPFHVMECSSTQDDFFDAVLERNVFVLHNPAKKVLYRNFYQQFQGKVNASGNISDLCRTAYGIQPVRGVKDLLAIVNLSDSEYAIDSLLQWYAEAKARCDTLGYNLRDLFFWEQVLGNWGSMFAAELDIAIDEFYPFGTRRLVETILAVNEKLRPYNNSLVHRKIIKLLWPELLSEPINPTSRPAFGIRWLRQEVKYLLTRLGLLPHLQSLRSKVSNQQ